ncbi:neprilysin-4 [Drosophila albomicans]|uniref:Neprilysin-4 n=1 Tax=Drosophila albomicans TaxID=7291 RepID=A0A6P8XZ85_DROAB|nr:neprilysin-4 [Drosophila albomicans]
MWRKLLFVCALLWGGSDALSLSHAPWEQDVEDAMDVQKSPCENFHEHACGNWHAPYGLRALGAHDMRSRLRALNKQLFVRHFEASNSGSGSGNGNGLPEGEQELHSLYDSCMNGRQALHVYMDAVQRVLPDWPLLNNATQFSWSRGSAAVRRFGAHGLWRLLVQQNWQAGEQQVFYVLPPSFELIGRSDMSRFLYRRYLKYLLLELGLRVRRAADLAEQLSAFEEQLQQLLPAAQDSAEALVLHAPQTLQQLHTQFPQLQLLEYFQLLLGDEFTPQLLLVADTEYLQRLPRLLETTDPLIVSSWLLLQLPAHFELHLHEDLSLAAQREQCLQQLNRLMPQQLSQLLLRLLHGSDAAAAAFYSRTQHELQQVFDRLKLQFERLMNDTYIFELDATSQAQALHKVRAMRLLLPQVQPVRQQSQQQLQPALSYDAKLLQLSQAQSLQQFRLALSCLQLPCDTSVSASTGPSLGSLDVNVYYRLKLNAIELPLGLLRAPLLHNSVAPSNFHQVARLYGGLGFMIAHEMVHGFDYVGIHYDAAGHLAAEDWPARTIIRFGVRSQCYLNYRYSNATVMINENMADSEGLRLAFSAYREQLAQQQLNSTALGSFFVAFAQNWCGHSAAVGTAAPSSGQQQQHPAHWERVNNVLGNFAEFAEAFDCRAGSLMNPPDKCRMW